MSLALALQPTDHPILSMANGLKQTTLNAFRQLMRPLVRILLRHGISFAEFEETTKMVFVEVAHRDFLNATTLSGDIAVDAVAECTGLSTDEIQHTKHLIATTAAPSNENLNRIGKILAGWHQDPSFTGPYGLPLELTFEDGPNSFTELARRYCSDVPAAELLKELERVGVVSTLQNGQIRVLTRAYIPAQTDSAIVQFMGVSLRDLAETLDCNLGEDESEGYFERRVWTPEGISKSDMPLFDQLVNQKGQEFLETLDNWLSARETDAEKLPDSLKVRVGVGVYLFSDAGRSFRED